MKKLLSIILVCSFLVSTLVFSNVIPSIKAKAAVTVSRVVVSPEGKGYLEVDGKPFLNVGVQNCGRIQIVGQTAPFANQKPVSFLENMFEKTAAANFKVAQTIIRWSDIEATQGVYDYTVLDKYIDWCNTYGLYLDIVWMGTNSCGGTPLLSAGGKGWRYVAPLWTQDQQKYWGAGVRLEHYMPFLTGTDADNLHNLEINAVKNMFNHIAVKDTNHRTILFQVNNEPNGHSSWATDKATVINRLNNLAGAVKTSNYVVATRVNLMGGSADSALKTSNIDFNGSDPYTTSVASIKAIVSDTNASNLTYIAENKGSYDNGASLLATALVNGGFYDFWELNDHWNLTKGIYDPAVSYVNWTLGTIPALRESLNKVKRLNAGLNKEAQLIAKASKTKMVGLNIDTDTPATSYNAFKTVTGYDIGFSTTDGHIGMVVIDGTYAYCISETDTATNFMTKVQPLGVTKGYLDGAGIWVSQGNVSYVNNGDGTYSIPYNAEDCVRIALPEIATANAFENENLVTRVSTGDTEADFADVNCSNGNGNKLTANAVGDYIEYDLSVTQSGTYNIKVKQKNQYSRGIYQLSLPQAGVNVGSTQDNYAVSDTYVEVDLGNYTFNSSGTKRFRFNIVGKNASSTGYSLGIDYIKLTLQ